MNTSRLRWTWWHTAIVSAICIGITLLIYFTLNVIFIIFLFIPPMIMLKQLDAKKRRKKENERKELEKME